MHLLDTDTLLHLHARHPRVIERMERIREFGVGTTIVTRIEILRARFDFVLKAANRGELLLAQSRLRQSEALLSQIIVIGFDDAAASQFDALGLARKSRTMERADLLIASIALAARATLVTRNLRHFRAITNLKLDNWVD